MPSAPGSRPPMSSAASAVNGTSRSRRRISTRSVAAPVPGCSYSVSRPTIASESARTVSTPTSKLPASTACSMFSAMRASSSREELVLLGDGERQQPVEEARHRRQLLLEVAFVDQLEAGGVREAVERPAVDVAAPERDVEAPERRLRVDALQVVALAKEGLVVAAHGGLGIALAAGDRAQAVEPPRDGGDEPPLPLHVCRHGPEQGRRSLVRPVGSAEALDGLVGPPARLQQIVDAALGIGAGEIGVIAAPGPARHREHEYPLGRVHGRRRSRRGSPMCRPGPQRQALTARVGDLQHPARAAGDLGDGSCPKRCTIWSSADWTGGRAASFSMRRRGGQRPPGR